MQHDNVAALRAVQHIRRLGLGGRLGGGEQAQERHILPAQIADTIDQQAFFGMQGRLHAFAFHPA